MSFLNPILLFGLAAVAVPILIHLLNRRKFRKVVWAAMRFLEASVERNQKRMRIEDLLLLALRCLLLALLALALARPALVSKAGDLFGPSKVTGVILLDNSYSMGMSDGATTRFDKARRGAGQVLDALPAGSSTALFLASDVADAVIPEPTLDLSLARKMIREATLTDRGTDLFPALNRALETLKDRRAGRKEIYLITDGQATGWRQLREIQKLLEKSREEVRTQIILVGDQEERNLGVSELRLASGLSPINQPLRFEVKVTNYGREEVRDTRVSLRVDQEPASDEFALGLIPPGATKSVSLFTRLTREGFHSVTARIPADRLPADDERSVVVRGIKEVKVLLVDGEPGGEPRDGETFFLRHALVPVAPELAESYFIKTVTLAAPELPSARLDEFDAVILANVPDFPDTTVRAVQQYLRRGGGLIIFPGAKLNTAFYNEQLCQRYQLLPAELGGLRGQADQDEKFFSLQEKDYQHPIVTLWNDPGSGTLSSARFYQAYTLQPAPASPPAGPRDEKGKAERTQEAGDPEVILRFTDGTPAVMERTWGLGRVVLFSSTADTAWNDLPVRLSFVPLIHRTLGSLVQRQDEGLTLRVGEKFSRRVGLEALGQDATFHRPRQTDVLRDLRRVELRNGWPWMTYDRTDLAGVYEASIAEPAFSLKFATQADPAESSLEELSPAQLKGLGEAAGVIPWTPNLSLQSAGQRLSSGTEFWLPLVVAALLVGLAESFLGQWFSRSK